MAYKSPRATYILETHTKLLITSTQGMCPMVVIWLMEKKDSLRSMVLTTIGFPARYHIIGRGCTRKEGTRSRIGPDVVALLKDRPAHYDRTTKGWTDDDHGAICS